LKKKIVDILFRILKRYCTPVKNACRLLTRRRDRAAAVGDETKWWVRKKPMPARGSKSFENLQRFAPVVVPVVNTRSNNECDIIEITSLAGFFYIRFPPFELNRHASPRVLILRTRAAT